MKIVVTGGAGFIASHIVDAYIRDGHEVTVLDDLSAGQKKFVNKKAQFYQVDIRKKGEIEAIFRKEKPDIVNHHAAQISVRNSVADPFFDLEVNLIGILNLLDAGQKTDVKKFIFASSGGAVYGESETIPTPETYTPLAPQSPYGVTKLASEYYLNYFYQSFKIPYITLRYSNVYGPRQNPHGEAGVVAIFTNRLLKAEIPLINGDGLQTRDYIYVGDVVEANRKALALGKIGSFNIGTSKETNVIELFTILKEITHAKLDAKYGPAKQGEQKRSCLNCDLAKEILHWQAKVDLKDGLTETVEYLKNENKKTG